MQRIWSVKRERREKKWEWEIENSLSRNTSGENIRTEQHGPGQGVLRPIPEEIRSPLKF